MTLLAVFANFVVLEGLVTPGDAEQIAGMGEVVLMIWLLINGRRVSVASTPAI